MIKKIHGTSSYLFDENLNNSFIAGNKIRKVKAILDKQICTNGVLSFGSPYSSHILACAWWSKKLSIPFIGIIITDKLIQPELYPHLKMAERFGAKLIYTSTSDANYTIDLWKEKFSEYLWIPGGAHTLEAAKAYEVLFDKLFNEEVLMQQIRNIILPYGTGTTAYGIWKSVAKNNNNIKLIGVSVSRKKAKCFQAISSLENVNDFPGLIIVDNYSDNYGEISDNTELYRWRFFNETGVLPDPVYNAKSIHYYYEHKMENTLVVNTGGMLNNLL